MLSIFSTMNVAMFDQVWQMHIHIYIYIQIPKTQSSGYHMLPQILHVLSMDFIPNHVLLQLFETVPLHSPRSVARGPGKLGWVGHTLLRNSGKLMFSGFGMKCKPNCTPGMKSQLHHGFLICHPLDIQVYHLQSVIKNQL